MTPDLALTDGWSLPRRLAFRFVFVYALLYSLPSPFDILPGFDRIGGLVDKAWDGPVRWLAARVLRLPGPLVAPNGSGDTTFNYVQVLLMAALALVAALVWSILQRGRRGHARLDEGLRVYLRWVLGISMLGYGFAKVLKTQFPFPPVDWLDQTLGASSPMRLVWAFMGYSTAYNVFTGGAEVLGGMFLFFRRTTTLGALVLLAVMSNVVMLNFCYDVPVKLYSLHLVAMALWLLWPDLRRLVDVLVLHRPVEGRAFAPRFERPWLRWALAGLKVAALLWFIGLQVQMRNRARAMQAGTKASVPIAGLWEVETFSRGGVEVPPLLTDASRWRKVSIYAYGALQFRTMSDKRWGFNVQFDLPHGLLNVPHGQKDNTPTTLRFTQPDPEHLRLEGNLQGEDLRVLLRRVDVGQMPLVSRGFHWINEFPYNR